MVQADPEGPEERAADMGAAFPCGRRPKSRASRPWKSSMAGARIDGSVARSLAHSRSSAYAACRSALADGGREQAQGGSGQELGPSPGGAERKA